MLKLTSFPFDKGFMKRMREPMINGCSNKK